MSFSELLELLAEKRLNELERKLKSLSETHEIILVARDIVNLSANPDQSACPWVMHNLRIGEHYGEAIGRVRSCEGSIFLRSLSVEEHYGKGIARVEKRGESIFFGNRQVELLQKSGRITDLIDQLKERPTHMLGANMLAHLLQYQEKIPSSWLYEGGEGPERVLFPGTIFRDSRGKRHICGLSMYSSPQSTLLFGLDEEIGAEHRMAVLGSK